MLGSGENGRDLEEGEFSGEKTQQWGGHVSKRESYERSRANESREGFIGNMGFRSGKKGGRDPDNLED